MPYLVPSIILQSISITTFLRRYQSIYLVPSYLLDYSFEILEKNALNFDTCIRCLLGTVTYILYFYEIEEEKQSSGKLSPSYREFLNRIRRRVKFT